MGAARPKCASARSNGSPNRTTRARRQSAPGPPTALGSRDLVGRVWEWTLDFDAYAIAADGAVSCSGAAARAADPTDYPAFMRYSMRESLKANYTADNLGFRCAGGAP